MKGTKKKKNKSELFTSQKYFPILIHFYANLWKTSPTNKILYGKCWGETFFTVIAVRTMAGSYFQLIIMHNFGKFQPGMLVLIIWQRHRAICFSLGLRFHCLHTTSNICIFWVNIVPTSGLTNHLWKFRHRIKYCTIKKQKRASPEVEPSSSARASMSLTTAPLCHSSQCLVKWLCFF